MTAQNGAEKREKFVTLAEKRTVNAIRAIRTIGKLGNPNAYKYTDADVRKIAKALGDEIEAMKKSNEDDTIAGRSHFQVVIGWGQLYGHEGSQAPV